MSDYTHANDHSQIPNPEFYDNNTSGLFNTNEINFPNNGDNLFTASNNIFPQNNQDDEYHTNHNEYNLNNQINHMNYDHFSIGNSHYQNDSNSLNNHLVNNFAKYSHNEFTTENFLKQQDFYTEPSTYPSQAIANGFYNNQADVGYGLNYENSDNLNMLESNNLIQSDKVDEPVSDIMTNLYQSEYNQIKETHEGHIVNSPLFIQQTEIKSDNLDVVSLFSKTKNKSILVSPTKSSNIRADLGHEQVGAGETDKGPKAINLHAVSREDRSLAPDPLFVSTEPAGEVVKEDVNIEASKPIDIQSNSSDKKVAVDLKNSHLPPNEPYYHPQHSEYRPRYYRGRRGSLYSHSIMSEAEADNDSYLSDAHSFVGGGNNSRRTSRYQRYFPHQDVPNATTSSQGRRRGQHPQPGDTGNYNTDVEGANYYWDQPEDRRFRHNNNNSRRIEYDSHYDDDESGRYFGRGDHKHPPPIAHPINRHDEPAAQAGAGGGPSGRRRRPSNEKSYEPYYGRTNAPDSHNYSRRYHREPNDLYPYPERSDSRGSASITRDSHFDKPGKITAGRPYGQLNRNDHLEHDGPSSRRRETFKEENSRFITPYAGQRHDTSSIDDSASVMDQRKPIKDKSKKIQQPQLPPMPPGPGSGGTPNANALYWQQYQMMAQNMYTNYYKMMATNYPQAMNMYFPGMTNPLEHLNETLEEDSEEEESESDSEDELGTKAPEETVKEPLLYTRAHVVARFSPNGSLLVLMSRAIPKPHSETIPQLDRDLEGLKLSDEDPQTSDDDIKGGKKQQTLKIVNIQNFFKDIDSFRRYPGPLTKTETHKDDVIKYCVDLIALHASKYNSSEAQTPNSSSVASSRQNIPSAISQEDRYSNLEGDKQDYHHQRQTYKRSSLPSSFELLVRYLMLSIKQNGAVVGADVSKLLMSLQGGDDSDLTSYTFGSNNKLASLHFFKGNQQSLPTSSFLPPEEFMFQYREILLCGHQKEALDFAVKNQSWGHAFYLASQMDARILTSITNKFLNTLTNKDPILTLYQTLAGKESSYLNLIQSAPLNKPNPTEWRSQLAMMLANPTSHLTKDRKNIEALGDVLGQNGDMPAAHFCYLLAHLNFGEYADKTSKIILLAASFSSSFKKFASPDSIRLTEIFEYIDQLASRRMLNDTSSPKKSKMGSTFLPHLQFYKFIYCCWLIDRGFIGEALRYLEVIASAITLQPQLYNSDLIRNVFQLASRLRYMDPHFVYLEDVAQFGDTAKDNWCSANPHWLSELRDLIEDRCPDNRPNLATNTSPSLDVNAKPLSLLPLPPLPVITNTFTSVQSLQDQNIGADASMGTPLPPLPTLNFADFKFKKADRLEHENRDAFKETQTINHAANFTDIHRQSIQPGERATREEVSVESAPLQPVLFFSVNQPQPFPITNTLNAPPAKPELQPAFGTTVFDPPLAKSPELASSLNPYPIYSSRPTSLDFVTPESRSTKPSTSFASSMEGNYDRNTYDAYQDNQDGRFHGSYGNMAHSQTFPNFNDRTDQAHDFSRLSKQDQSKGNYMDDGIVTDFKKAANKSINESNIRNSSSKGWFGGIIKKILPKGSNEMILPEDKDKSIVWNDALKRWENADGTTPADEMTPPPPTDKELYMYGQHHQGAPMLQVAGAPYQQHLMPSANNAGSPFNNYDGTMQQDATNIPYSNPMMASNFNIQHASGNGPVPAVNSINAFNMGVANPQARSMGQTRRSGKSPYIDVFAKSQNSPLARLSP